MKKLLKDKKISFLPDELGKCTLYNNNCYKEKRTEQLDELDSGPFIFEKHRFMVGSSDETINKINNAKLDDIDRKTKLCNKSISYY
ncbi:24371_t:CDS:2 [Cetraspora pellucida]|uniref:24371_t:CDS:1 n=1 Tax=Cetraspora pellucida TaxID=1433469 RepID=A0A9N9I2I6_9GLOM|nr:24371_t:CDS:2 [Cetraspora pellucida]